MASDSERREVAENLRYLADYPGAPVRYAEQFRDELSAVVLPDEFTHDYSELIQRLADLIEPSRDATATHTDAPATCDVSQSCRGDAYPTERGIDSIYEWCHGRLEGADGAEDYLYCTIMSAIEEYRHPERVTARTARPVDREARWWTSFNERLPEPGAPVLCKGKNGAYYVGKPVTFGGERTAKVWVPHGNEYRSPAVWRPIEPPSCDREALLALAGELDRSLGWCEPDERRCVHVSVGRLREVARRIREACGVVDAG